MAFGAAKMFTAVWESMDQSEAKARSRLRRVTERTRLRRAASTPVRHSRGRRVRIGELGNCHHKQNNNNNYKVTNSSNCRPIVQSRTLPVRLGCCCWNHWLSHFHRERDKLWLVSQLTSARLAGLVLIQCSGDMLIQTEEVSSTMTKVINIIRSLYTTKTPISRKITAQNDWARALRGIAWRAFPSQSPGMDFCPSLSQSAPVSPCC